MVNAGTDTGGVFGFLFDLREDLVQPFGLSVDTRASISNARKLSNQLRNKELTFIGHSKGGQEAAANAIATNRNAILFNPAAISASLYGLDSKKYTGADENGMTVYIVQGEFLNYINRAMGATPIDKVIYLPQQSQ